jgi:glycosyltransferase involved in cell wall biosynthesis
LRLNFISNLDLSEKSGGWSGINVAIHQQLSTTFDTVFVGPIDPDPDYPAKLRSKLQRLKGNPGSFHFFSDRRLSKIAKLVGQKLDPSADCNFFHGATPWIHFRSSRPYFLYLDTCFSTYLDVYHERSQFLDDDVRRICAQEGEWLSEAAGVFFGTQWALNEAVAAYGLPTRNLRAVGAAGSMSPPLEDRYQGGLNFLFIALDFEKKGGFLAAEAFARFSESNPGASLAVVGQRPLEKILEIPGVSYAGFLNKSEAKDLERLESLLAHSFALIHPTSSDIQPLVICEAAYFGCPAIAANSFGIPELIINGRTGYVVDTPLTVEPFVKRMHEMAGNEELYMAMRGSARHHALNHLTWDIVGGRVTREIYRALGTADRISPVNLTVPNRLSVH